MKVLCIDDRNQPFEPFVKFGEYYTILKTDVRPVGRCYQLKEFVEEYVEYWWLCSRFAPLSEIDETELVNEKQLVNQ